MNNKNIKRISKKFLKSLKGNADFENAENIIQKSGYKVIFYNTEVGDAELLRYNLHNKSMLTDAFTYNGTAKIIFINNNASAEEKVYLLYHEIGHILLGHLDYKRLSTKNKYTIEFEADTFANNVLHPAKTNRFSIAMIAFSIATIAISSFYIGKTCAEKTVVAMSVTPKMENTVYITSTGKKYHRQSCIHIQGRKIFTLDIQEAKNLYEPCKVCNPD